MKKVKGLSVFIAVIVLVLVVSACGKTNNSSQNASNSQPASQSTSEDTTTSESPSESKSFKIGFAVSTQQEERWVKEAKYFEDAVKALGGTPIVQFADNDESKQNDQIENMVSQGVDALVIASINGETIGPAVEAAKKAGIPVISYSRLITGVDYDAYIGFDIPGIGRDLARAAIAKVPTGNYMLLNGAPVDTVSHTIADGAKEILQPFIDKGEIKIVSEQFTDKWAPENALSGVENSLTQNNNKIDAIISSNDGMAGGAIQALKAQGLAGKTFVTGTDGDIAALQRIAEGTQSMTLLFPSKDMAELAAKAAYEMAETKTTPSNATGETDNKFKQVPTIFVSTVTVTKENINETVIKSGFAKLEDVFKNVPQDQWPK
ncbi:MAG: substrate-binding domain-containing protein [Candidatus Cohnella colombiensis]|uniref:Substrate-binding domain-containing protein n=1 Tax=Candidatus Cohnella colombiensis TaxID=3121368 RepID=A0AA95EYR6_9BACL|nr:MAG: substrate-binding domain-containing protein [Cohnella sp.]